jgi:hypothetical protein
MVHLICTARRILVVGVALAMVMGAGPTTRPSGGRPTTQMAMPSTLPADTAVEALQGYLRAIRAGYPDAAVTAYLDSYGLLDLVTGSETKLKGEEREQAAADIRLMIEASWQMPGLAEMMRTSALSIKGSKQGADGLTQVDYVLTVTQPRRVELPNTVYLRKAKDGWRVVDMNQPNQPRMSEALRSGYLSVVKVDPTAKLEAFLFDVMRSVRRRAVPTSGPAGGGATPRPTGATTRPVGR